MTTSDKTAGTLLQELTWMQARDVLGPETLVVIPLGAACKEHGPHLLLKNDLIIAEYCKDRVLEAADVVIAPTVGLHYYPAFVEYPGSIHLRLETARDLIIDVCTSLAAFGPRRFYVLNTGISTIRALRPAAEELARQGIVMRYTDLRDALGPVEDRLAEQDGGSHADEMETSMMLYIAPDTVDMAKAVKDYDPDYRGGLSPRADSGKTYSPTGIWGDPTLASREKGEIVVEALIAAILADIAALRGVAVSAAGPAEES